MLHSVVLRIHGFQPYLRVSHHRYCAAPAVKLWIVAMRPQEVRSPFCSQLPCLQEAWEQAYYPCKD